MSSISNEQFAGSAVNNNTRTTLAHLVNVKLAHLNDKWTSLLAASSSRNHTFDESQIVSSDGDGDGLRCINSHRKRRLRRYRSSGLATSAKNIGGDPKEFDMLVLRRTVDWDDDDSSY